MNRHVLFQSIILVTLCLCSCNCLIKSIPLPQHLDECFQRKTRNLNVTDFPGHAINSFCLNTYKSKQVDPNQELDVPKDILNWIHSLLRKFISARKKRQVFPRRLRKEIRALSEAERMDYFRAVLALKADTSIAPNKWDALARFHSGNLTIANAHDSSNFVGWHRVYLLVAEEALRTKVPHVTMPYWDSTKDFDMPDPVMSVVWTSQFFGNGDGIVTRGPFANWITGDNEPLIRNIGSSGMLMSRQGIMNILAQTFHFEITEGTAADPENSIEVQHNAVHNWVDGTMAGLNTAPQDPVFYAHHCFVDYVWNLFRRQQKARGINPADDYPSTNNSFHQPFFRMVGFEPLRNIDGYSNFWDEIVSYEDSPSCNDRNDCGSPYNDCIAGNCVSKDSSVVNEIPGGQMPHPSSMLSAGTMSSSMKAARMMGPLPIGKRFPYFLIDSRTRGDPLKTTKLKKKHKKHSSMNFMSMMHGVPGDDRRHVGTVLHNAMSSWRSVNNGQPLIQTQPHVNKPVTSSLDRSFQNTFLLDGVADVNRWVYIPVRIVNKRPNGQCFQPKLIHNGRVTDTQDMYAPSNYQNLQTGSSSPAKYAKCSVSNSGVEKIFVQTDGISYTGKYKDYVIIDGRQPVSSAIAYVAVKNPNLGQSKVYLSAFDLCGRMCKPRCLNLGSANGMYKPCSGAIVVTKDFPTMFGRNFGEAVTNTWNLKNTDCPDTLNKNIYMTFYCENDNTWPWL